MHEGEKARKKGSTWLWNPGQTSLEAKQGYQWSHKKELCPSKILKKKTRKSSCVNARGTPPTVQQVHVGYLPLDGGYLLWPGVPWPGGSTYLGWGVPTLAGGWNYLGWGGYLPWLGGVPTLAGGTHLGQGIPQVWTDKQTVKTITFHIVLRMRAVIIRREKNGTALTGHPSGSAKHNGSARH